jgi:hypothetical protein
MATTASKAAERMPKKRMQNRSSGKGAPKKGCSVRYCKLSNTTDGLFKTHDTIKCRRFVKDSSPKDKPAKPFDAAKKPWNKTGSRKFQSDGLSN